MLLVEDDKTLRRVLTMLFESAGHHVTSASTAAEARGLAHALVSAGASPEPSARGPAVQLIVCDVRLSGERGDHLAHQLAVLLQPRGVLLLSGAERPADGPDFSVVPHLRTGFLRKPFDCDELIAMTNRLLR